MVAGALASAKSKSDAYKGSARANEAEAEQARLNAIQAEAVGQYKQKDELRQKKLMLSSLRAKSGASGLSFSDAGSAVAIADTETTGYLRSANALYEGSVKARQYRSQADALDYQAKLDKKSARTALIAGAIGAGSAAAGGTKGSTGAKKGGLS